MPVVNVGVQHLRIYFISFFILFHFSVLPYRYVTTHSTADSSEKTVITKVIKGGYLQSNASENTARVTRECQIFVRRKKQRSTDMKWTLRQFGHDRTNENTDRKTTNDKC